MALEALVHSEHDVVLVLTRPDAAAGRGMKQSPSDVRRLAIKYQLPVYQPATLKDPGVLDHLRTFDADAMVVAAYGLILPGTVIDAFRLGCINIHASLLPRWRGAAPIQHALLAGDKETGISIMRMDEGLDTGPVYLMQPVPIGADETAASLHAKLAELGARCIVRALAGIESGELKASPQPAEGTTYAHKITREQARIQWSDTAAQIERAIRAFNPFPGAFSRLNEDVIKIWAALPRTAAPAPPGQVLEVSDDGIVVACGQGALRLTELQRQGGKRLPVGDFVRGFAIEPGQRFID
jgi:methionyl-tRNA formyltransferase